MKELKELKKKIYELELECIGKPDSKELQDLKERYDNIMCHKKITEF